MVQLQDTVTSRYVSRENGRHSTSAGLNQNIGIVPVYQSIALGGEVQSLHV
jgi:hypothetical protein